MNIISTLDYYNKHAAEFVQGTVNVDFTDIQQFFLSYLPDSSDKKLILDLGCGSGRDSKYFLEHDFSVDAVDGSLELCKLAEQLLGQSVRCMLFQELNETEKYHGIWACASLLHLPKTELVPVLKRCATALKDNGVMYLSFKYGDFSGERNGRYFTDLNEISFEQLLQHVPKLKLVEYRITTDVRPGHANERWLNVIVRKDC